MDEATAITIIIGAISLAVTIIIYIASTHAVRVQTENSNPNAVLSRVDAEAYDRAKRVYEAAIDQLEEETVRLQSQSRDLQAEVLRQSAELARLRARLGAANSGAIPKINGD